MNILYFCISDFFVFIFLFVKLIRLFNRKFIVLILVLLFFVLLVYFDFIVIGGFIGICFVWVLNFFMFDLMRFFCLFVMNFRDL